MAFLHSGAVLHSHLGKRAGKLERQVILTSFHHSRIEKLSRVVHVRPVVQHHKRDHDRDNNNGNSLLQGNSTFPGFINLLC